jgi:hypothetical protein
VRDILPYLKSSILMLSIPVTFQFFEVFKAHFNSSFVIGPIPPVS